MEVHKHPHHVTHKKKWTEYLLEFFMLFLAVFLGFVAENIRESSVERHREKEYLESFVKNIQSDTGRLKSFIKANTNKVAYLDSLLQLSASNLSDSINISSIYYYFLKARTFANYIPNDATLVQLKNSGNLRIIQKVNVADSILAYDNLNKAIAQRTEVAQSSIDAAWQGSYGVLDLSILNNDAFYKREFIYNRPKYLSRDSEKLKYFFNTIFREAYAAHVYSVMLSGQLIYAKRLIIFIQKEYHLDNK
ncbi:MAG: hypothetical protein M3004_04515 [Bacteroidota bacterium]|nr:hypothetical protein [Bacteroidota bacterium]